MMISNEMLPVIFIGLMGLSMLIYAVLDGYDLGVGIILPSGNEGHRDRMIASIGPFWDANETWLVLGIGLMLVAFPAAHGYILGELYLPVSLMLVGLILRGVAFDFRAKARVSHKDGWDRAFQVGSLMATLSQGYMLGLYVQGFDESWSAVAFGLLSAVCVTAAYCYIGAAWLIMKTKDKLQLYALKRAKICLYLMALGILAVSIMNPIISPEVFEKWFTMPNVILLMPMPLLIFTLIVRVNFYINKRIRNAGTKKDYDDGCWIPFVAGVVIFFLSFNGLAYSFYPYVVPGQMTIWEAASAPESLSFILVGTLIVLPCILAYTAYSYRVFLGKADALSYER